MKINDLNSLFI
jgi:hypothetical protein